MSGNNWCVYKHTNKINGKNYIGITGKAVNQRWKKGNGYFSNRVFFNAIRKYGWEEGFTHEVLISGLTREEACEKEKELILAFDSKAPNGYNLTDGGDGSTGFVMTEEQKRAISIRNKGRKRSPEICEFLRRRQTGKRPDEATREKLRKAHTGRMHTEESKQKMSKIRKEIGITRQFIEAGNASHRKPVAQYSLNGELIKIWDCGTTAGEALNIERHGIYNCARGKTKSSFGYVWRYVNED